MSLAILTALSVGIALVTARTYCDEVNHLFATVNEAMPK